MLHKRGEGVIADGMMKLRKVKPQAVIRALYGVDQGWRLTPLGVRLGSAIFQNMCDQRREPASDWRRPVLDMWPDRKHASYPDSHCSRFRQHYVDQFGASPLAA
jgi:hypothetical protein